MSLETYRKTIQDFANKFGLVFDEQGEAGFGRECVGIRHGDNWIDYNPHSQPNYDSIPEFYDERLYDIVPPDAYHKHNCLAVLGRGEEAIKQLSEWVDKLNNLGATVEVYLTGATGIQAILTGLKGMAIKIPKI